MRIRVLKFVTLAAFGVAAAYIGLAGLSTLPPGVLGVDELGRNTLSAFVYATVLTCLKSFWLVILTASAAILFLVAAHAIRREFAATALRAALLTIESCPVILWVFVIIVVLMEMNFFYAVSLAFVIATTPLLVSIMFDEYDRLSRAEFVEAARASGLREFRIIRCYILPNTLQLLYPLFINLFGTAIAIYGAVGLIGMGNRSQLDLGVFILRAKERILIDPWLSVGIIMCIVGIYGLLYLIRRRGNRLMRWMG